MLFVFSRNFSVSFVWSEKTENAINVGIVSGYSLCLCVLCFFSPLKSEIYPPEVINESAIKKNDSPKTPETTENKFLAI